jgi:hypothetical protein
MLQGLRTWDLTEKMTSLAACRKQSTGVSLDRPSGPSPVVTQHQTPGSLQQRSYLLMAKPDVISVFTRR